ncbi:MAG: hypothetical protein HFG09_10075 [Oscillibacter sp.]|nr:hypothetical protein [Oscillibacter sp.]
MDLSTVSFLSFLGSTFMLYRFSRHSRFLAQSWKLTPEEAERYQVRARSALICAGVFMVICVAALLLSIILYVINH